MGGASGGSGGGRGGEVGAGAEGFLQAIKRHGSLARAVSSAIYRACTHRNTLVAYRPFLIYI